MTSHKGKNFKVNIYVYICIFQVKNPTYAELTAHLQFAVCVNEFQAVE